MIASVVLLDKAEGCKTCLRWCFIMNDINPIRASGTRVKISLLNINGRLSAEWMRSAGLFDIIIGWALAHSPQETLEPGHFTIIAF
jgi:hypothetical protein